MIDISVEALDNPRELLGRGEVLSHCSSLDVDLVDPQGDLSPSRANSCAGADNERPKLPITSMSGSFHPPGPPNTRNPSLSSPFSIIVNDPPDIVPVILNIIKVPSKVAVLPNSSIVWCHPCSL